ncbi:MAG: hypothetical protein RJA69_435 [Pseudomonadota bacterium]|jgi:hypothetical protein
MKTIVEMTREAGGFDATPEFLERFADLVRADERNRLSKECALLPFGDTAASFAVWIKNGGKA